MFPLCQMGRHHYSLLCIMPTFRGLQELFLRDGVSEYSANGTWYTRPNASFQAYIFPFAPGSVNAPLDRPFHLEHFLLNFPYHFILFIDKTFRLLSSHMLNTSLTGLFFAFTQATTRKYSAADDGPKTQLSFHLSE